MTEKTHIKITTKAETLERVAPLLRRAMVLPQHRFTLGQWRENPGDVIKSVCSRSWFSWPVIIRSSSLKEDMEGQSLAGCFASVADIESESELKKGIEHVAESLGGEQDDDQIFVQPMLRDVAFSGVLFTWDPNTLGPYFVANYSHGRATDQITSGRAGEQTVYSHHHDSKFPPPAELECIIDLGRELETLFDDRPIDIEFAVNTDQQVILLQVRYLVGDNWFTEKKRHADALSRIAKKVEYASQKHPYLAGKTSLFGVMPDWNPAEVIGVRPRPLALSLYRDLITDATWAYQRGNYGYRNLRSMPLMLSFQGLPYIDVRVSFNSFVPQDVDDELAERLVNYYLDRLADKPELHDKVEFDVVYSCYTLDLPKRVKALEEVGFSQADIERLTDSLRQLTNGIINNETGLWKQDLEKIHALERRLKRILGSGLDKISMVYWLLEDCRRYGTLPFAGLARAGFIAVQLLKSLISVGVLSEKEADEFFASLSTVASNLTRDKTALSKDSFLSIYGHLRPGTYDITSRRYDEAADQYFNWDKSVQTTQPSHEFQLSLVQLREIERLLSDHGLDHDVLGLFEFLKASIEGREYAKFVFTKSLSNALLLFRDICEEHGISVDDAAYADIRCITELVTSSDDPKRVIEQTIRDGRERYELTRTISLPSLIRGVEDIWSFESAANAPNFVSQGYVEGRVVFLENGRDTIDIEGKIVAIENADPGYDWIFSHNIRGLITQYGGINSHMAIRAGELSIPAVIGAGESNFSAWKQAKFLIMDCAGRRIEVMR